MKLSDMVQSYIKLRDKKSEMSAEHKQKVASVDALMAKLEGQILKAFNKAGVESAKTDAGTAYKSTQVSVTTADWDAFLNFVKSEGAWEMLEHRASKAAVEQYRVHNDELPPGVNWRENVTINVRRS